jgi:phosphate starvation-inducible PhoH-like protein
MYPHVNLGVHMAKHRPSTARRTRKQKVDEDIPPVYKTPKSIPLLAKTDKQFEYLQSLRDEDLIIVVGSAGTGKTYMAMTHAANRYVQGYIEKIVLTRPNVAAGGKSLGFHKGTVEEKVAPWAKPAVQILNKHLGPQKVEAMIKCGELVFEPFETMRGLSFEDAFVVLDEAQNATVEEMKMFLTRIGENTQTVIDGDIFQTDIPYDCGLAKVIHMTKQQMLPFPIIEFGVDDIVRSDLCAIWVRAFMTETANTSTNVSTKVDSDTFHHVD